MLSPRTAKPWPFVYFLTQWGADAATKQSQVKKEDRTDIKITLSESVSTQTNKKQNRNRVETLGSRDNT